eukprot:CAMPEP_0177627636 /NCGR_PEP_ID=MMETSP0419_2-20121207/31312_1 /TAXON_ID=582737 /ORGANISM="Tetraselmis sp., Strain GSL018" /LENGTH=534 /DNA_ID=CAMNT_0019128809 /DNA_START=303 /DNA_END=1907 /DNA_ORIENTATION=+
MVSNPEWPFRAEDSSVVTGFLSCFSLGENVGTAVQSLKASARSKTVSLQQISGLYRVFQIYSASLGVLTREVVSHVEASERLAQTVFSIGASRDHGSEDKSIRGVLGPLSEALWSMHLRFLYELGSYVKAPEELSEPVAAELLNKFSAGKTMATRFATISIVDYLFNLRKHVTKKDFWQLARRKIKLEQLRGFPKYRGMRLQILASLLSSIPPEEGEEEEEDDSPLLGIGLPSVIAIAVGTGAVLLLGIVVALLIWRRSAKAKMRSVAPDDTTSGKSSAGGSRAALLSSPVAEASEKARRSSARVHPRDGSPGAQLSRRGAAALPEDAPDSDGTLRSPRLSAFSSGASRSVAAKQKQGMAGYPLRSCGIDTGIEACPRAASYLNCLGNQNSSVAVGNRGGSGTVASGAEARLAVMFLCRAVSNSALTNCDRRPPAARGLCHGVCRPPADPVQLALCAQRVRSVLDHTSASRELGAGVRSCTEAQTGRKILRWMEILCQRLRGAPVAARNHGRLSPMILVLQPSEKCKTKSFGAI